MRCKNSELFSPVGRLESMVEPEDQPACKALDIFIRSMMHLSFQLACMSAKEEIMTPVV